MKLHTGGCEQIWITCGFAAVHERVRHSVAQPSTQLCRWTPRENSVTEFSPMKNITRDAKTMVLSAPRHSGACIPVLAQFMSMNYLGFA